MSRNELTKVVRTALIFSRISSAGLLACSAGGSSAGTPSVMAPPSGGGGGASMAPPLAPEVTPAAPPNAVPNTVNDLMFGELPTVDPSAPPPAPVVTHRGLTARLASCEGGATTSVSGTVYIPSGELPLYNVMVYVPETNLQPFTPGASCTCEITGDPITSTLTDASGKFVLENVPVGPNVPLVIQVGDWRRELDIGTVEPCVNTALPDRMLTLPKNQREGDIPKIAVATGRLDALECLIRKLGVDDSEFTNPRDGGRVQLFAGLDGTESYAPSLNGGEILPPARALWYDVESLEQYDLVLLSCEGDRGYVGNKPPNALRGMFDYANLGGRIFASHFHGVWFQEGPAPFPDMATFTSKADSEYQDIVGQVVTSFPKGVAMQQWIENVGVTVDGGIPIHGGAHTIVEENTAYAQRWLETTDPPSVQYLSANTPLGASDADQCGRVVLSDLHVSEGPPEGDFSSPLTEFPEGCVTATLSPQETVLAFMLFDLSACIIPDDQAPVAPPIIR